VSAGRLFFLGRLAIVRNRAAGEAAELSEAPTLHPASQGHRP